MNAAWYEEDGGKPEQSSLLRNKDEGSRVDVPFFARSKPKPYLLTYLVDSHRSSRKGSGMAGVSWFVGKLHRAQSIL